VQERLSYLAEMGFDVLYLPPIHPIGRTYRKGKNNALHAASQDPGSPWAIGAEEGGHKSVDPRLGTLEDFRRLVRRAREYGIEVALDIALQCSPDHPYVREHPEWFRRRPDGAVQYAENPPKKYEDLYPFDFETADWHALWQEMKSIFTFWLEQGVRIFRVDNPHTKPFRFWEWLIAEVKRDHPDVIFLSEAFTRPKVMYHLAKIGFTQSYTYFTWRNTRQELTDYFTELTQTPVREFFRPCAWPNTPDILTAGLQTGGRPAFMTRLVLAATLCSNYGIYGPAFELMERTPQEPGSEEYINSEKYEIRRWDVRRRDSLRDLIAAVNRARRENPALQANGGLRFHYSDNDELLCYSKEASAGGERNVIVCVVNLDARYVQSGWVQLPIRDWHIPPDKPYVVHDLLTGARYTWQGPVNYVQLNPHEMPAHVFRLAPGPETAGG
jgi:starch synthase (maltosyl-transferring)